jgi:hypothetical protein
MSAFIPNCRVTILDSGFTPDGNGDDQPDGVPVAEHLPAFWAQKDQRTQDPVSGRWSVTKGYLVRFRPGTVVTARVNHVSDEATLAMAGDVVVRAVAITR